ncbi:MAG: hypothetical protein GYA55_08415 [SAR324 cluster bacterium]|uniref:Uncharacterized protein n=1 Tax=SAR324 cluster bacterium TaxID=2024889 RepID=A0A7X9IKJ2_9DELT|nr:hypothetical protein [SAR324 cluster bacterium]
MLQFLFSKTWKYFWVFAEIMAVRRFLKKRTHALYLQRMPNRLLSFPFTDALLRRVKKLGCEAKLMASG